MRLLGELKDKKALEVMHPLYSLEISLAVAL